MSESVESKLAKKSLITIDNIVAHVNEHPGITGESLASHFGTSYQLLETPYNSDDHVGFSPDWPSLDAIGAIEINMDVTGYPIYPKGYLLDKDFKSHHEKANIITSIVDTDIGSDDVEITMVTSTNDSKQVDEPVDHLSDSSVNPMDNLPFIWLIGSKMINVSLKMDNGSLIISPSKIDCDDFTSIISSHINNQMAIGVNIMPIALVHSLTKVFPKQPSVSDKPSIKLKQPPPIELPTTVVTQSPPSKLTTTVAQSPPTGLPIAVAIKPTTVVTKAPSTELPTTAGTHLPVVKKIAIVVKPPIATVVKAPYIEAYGKGYVILGNTKPHKDLIKLNGGKWNSHLGCGGGWIFTKDKLPVMQVLVSELQ